MNAKLLSEQNLYYLSFKGNYTGLSECTLVKIPCCWKPRVMVQLLFEAVYQTVYLILVCRCYIIHHLLLVLERTYFEFFILTSKLKPKLRTLVRLSKFYHLMVNKKNNPFLFEDRIEKISHSQLPFTINLACLLMPNGNSWYISSSSILTLTLDSYIIQFIYRFPTDPTNSKNSCRFVFRLAYMKMELIIYEGCPSKSCPFVIKQDCLS